MQQREDLLKQIPHVDKVLQHEVILTCEAYRHEAADAVRAVLTELREGIKSGAVSVVPGIDTIAKNAVELAVSKVKSTEDVRRVINGTGVILHSNLGRACLSKAASEAVTKTASSYCTLEYDVKKGERGNRAGGVGKYLKNITGCEASLVVNNNAAAVLLILAAVASDGNVIVSRGELVEIGGGFRIPDIMELCGCELREVGTTNKTRTDDYGKAIDDNTRAILKVHSSNFQIVGFTESVSVAELASLGKKYDLPVIEDIGSGALVDVQRYKLKNEPLAKESLKKGADVVCFSGDKLLGGLQCGIILGSSRYITEIKKHPLYRAFRVDKITIAALEATLRVYGDQQLAERDIPVLSMLSAGTDELNERAEKICGEINKRGGAAEVLATKSVAGGGAVPGLELDSYAVMLISKESTDGLEERLRNQPVPIIGHIENDRLLIDVRTLFEEDYEYIISSIVSITGKD
ncbi:MAG: L-seryl-tRNA(Sec) selenium transferase [Oscillospiraceae bacterium]|nr:L-seryl-tRNA(Sec) selenium transferase [Oscillospiraceae bacterium]